MDDNAISPLGLARPPNNTTIIFRDLEKNQKFMNITGPCVSMGSPAASVSDATSTRRYSYEKLPGPNHVRLLQTNYDEATNSHTFDFITAPLEEVRDGYVAVSYCWGKQPADRSLVLDDGAVIPITANVEALLGHIFGGHDQEYLWLDAVCINQDDVAERTAQVKIMKDIYQAARRVSIWLGAPDGDSFEAAKTLLLWINGWEKLSGKENYEEEGSDLQTFADTSLLFGSLVGLAWFSRVWVIQEVCFAKVAWFHYGRFQVTMEYFQMIFTIIEYIHPQAASGGDMLHRSGVQIFQKLEGCRKELEKKVKGESDGFMLEGIYTSLIGHHATDPRDRIFGLLGMADPESFDSCIIPDYSMETWDVYVHATAKMIKHSKYLQLLARAGIAQRRACYGGRDLPSWVPDFAATPSHTTLPATLFTAGLALSKANTGAVTYCERFSAFVAPGNDISHGVPCPARPRSESCPSPHIELLLAEGTRVDAVAGVLALAEGQTEVSRSADGLEEVRFLTVGGLLALLEQSLALCTQLVSAPSGPYHATGEPAAEVCARTIIVNSIRRLARAPDGGNPVSAAEQADLPDLGHVLEQMRGRVADGTLDAAAVVTPRNIHRMALQGELTTPFWVAFFAGSAGTYRRVFWTERGYVGLGLAGVEVGDEVWLVAGSRVPFVARHSRPFDGLRKSRQPLQKLVGEAYVHGIMAGEASEFDNLDTDTFLLLE